MDAYESFGFIAILLALVIVLPPLLRLYKSEHKLTLPPSSLAVLALTFVLWTIYGIGNSAMALVVASIIAFVITGLFLLRSKK